MSIKYESMNPLPQETRDKMVAVLNGIMADILDNHYQSLLAHWNTRGANFIALHEFFDEYAGSNGAENWCDWVAERISQLGGTVVTTVQFISTNTSLTEYPLTITTGEDHVQALAISARTIIVRLRDAIAEALVSLDNVTADVLTDVQRSAEKYLWLLEAHVPKPRRPPGQSS
jgi:starvation-inducible DNA-binding protein